VRIEGRALPAAGAATVDEHDMAGSELAAGLLGLPGFRVLAVAEHDGELQVQVETTEDLVGCPSCAAVAVLHDRRLRLVRDLPAGGRPVLLCWSKRVWRCPHRACPQLTFSERTAGRKSKLSSGIHRTSSSGPRQRPLRSGAPPAAGTLAGRGERVAGLAATPARPVHPVLDEDCAIRIARD